MVEGCREWSKSRIKEESEKRNTAAVNSNSI